MAVNPGEVLCECSHPRREHGTTGATCFHVLEFHELGGINQYCPCDEFKEVTMAKKPTEMETEPGK